LLDDSLYPLAYATNVNEQVQQQRSKPLPPIPYDHLRLFWRAVMQELQNSESSIG
jgi:hypothetical protein